MNIMYLINDFEIVDSIVGGSATEDINNLLKQLSPNAKRMSRRHLGDVMYFGYFFWAIDKDTMTVVGIATLTKVFKPTAYFGTMEDVVIDEAYRGKGIATELIKMLLEKAKEEGMTHVEFTSHPGREAANKLYLSMGAERRETNVYRFKI